MKAIIYKNGKLIQRTTVSHLDVSSKVLSLYSVIMDGEKKVGDYYYAGNITFTLVTDVLSIDIFEPDEKGGLDHIRITAFDWN